MTNSTNQTKIKIDTIQTRKQIGFTSKEGWINSKAQFTDETLKIHGHPVMEGWEDGYMDKLAEIATSQKGTVLEIGYGMGISSRKIQSRPNIDSHLVIECHPDVVAKATRDFREEISKQRINFMQGFWEDITPLLKDASFDGILFDTYPLSEEEIHGNHFWFFNEAYRLLRKGGVLTYYSDEVSDLSKEHTAKLVSAGFDANNIDFEVVNVKPPEDCEYWQYDTIVAPIVTK